MLRDKDTKATEAYIDLEVDSEKVIEGLTTLKADAARSEQMFRELGQWAASVTALDQLSAMALTWSLHMRDAGNRLTYEIEAIETTLQRMKTYVVEKNAMIEHISEAIRDIRYIHDRSQMKPNTTTSETQTDAPEPLVDVSKIKIYI